MNSTVHSYSQNIPGINNNRSHQGLSHKAPGQEVRATLAGFEGPYALLSLSDSNELIRWPKSKVPGQAQIGDTLLLEAISLETLQEEELNRMRKLLEELIN